MLIQSVMTRTIMLLAITGFLMMGMMPQAKADMTYHKVYSASTHTYRYVPDKPLKEKVQSKLQEAWKNPEVKDAAVGAAAGTVLSLFADHGHGSLMKGLGIGALVGAGTGYMDKHGLLNNKPLLKSSLKGAAIGTGAGMITGGGALKGAVVGTAAGAGAHFLQNYMETHKP